MQASATLGLKEVLVDQGYLELRDHKEQGSAQWKWNVEHAPLPMRRSEGPTKFSQQSKLSQHRFRDDANTRNRKAMTPSHLER